jgi:hypothetical protein
VNAIDLQPGQLLRTSAGTWTEVTSVETRTEDTAVHNLTINDTHTYYVIAGTTPVLVHNTSGALCGYHAGERGADETVCTPECRAYKPPAEADSAANQDRTYGPDELIAETRTPSDPHWVGRDPVRDPPPLPATTWGKIKFLAVETVRVLGNIFTGGEA